VRHLDLFSGIGGFAHAAQQVWGKEYECVGFCEIDPFCQAVLKKHWPKVKITNDIRKLTADTKSKQNRRLQSKGFQPDIGSSIDLLTGGFPCQPFSQAGKRRGTTDDRFLWPEMFRVIKEFSPRWVIAENVRGIINIENGLVFEQVCLDLEGAGYEVQPFIIPACAKNAPHRRDRVWIVALHSAGDGRRGSPPIKDEKRYAERPISSGKLAGGFEGSYCHAKDAISQRRRGRRNGDQTGVRRSLQTSRSNSNAPDTGNEGLQGRERSGSLGERSGASRSAPKRSWNENWLEVATSLCLLDDGLSRKLVRLPDGRKISYAKWRVEALKAAGNSIVPQVAMEIMEGIKNADRNYAGNKGCGK